jgi:hypothetical protein
MSKDFTFLRHWITGEGYHASTEPRPAILECIPSRSCMSMTVYDRGERIYTINGYGFDRLGCALAEFLEACFMLELKQLCLMADAPKEPGSDWEYTPGFSGLRYHRFKRLVQLEGATGFESMREIANAIGLKVRQSQSKAGTLIIIEKGV